ncbi:hypothetical protein D3C86_1981980 [compost metagenome]
MVASRKKVTISSGVKPMRAGSLARRSKFELDIKSSLRIGEDGLRSVLYRVVGTTKRGGGSGCAWRKNARVTDRTAFERGFR